MCATAYCPEPDCDCEGVHLGHLPDGHWYKCECCGHEWIEEEQEGEPNDAA